MAYDSNNLELVRIVFFETDPYGLLEMGAPSCEYDMMADRVTALLGKCDSVEDIAEIITAEFNASFSENRSSRSYLGVAQVVAAKLGW